MAIIDEVPKRPTLPDDEFLAAAVSFLSKCTCENWTGAQADDYIDIEFDQVNRCHWVRCRTCQALVTLKGSLYQASRLGFFLFKLTVARTKRQELIGAKAVKQTYQTRRVRVKKEEGK